MNQTISNFSLSYYRDRFVENLMRKEDLCPICGKIMKYISVRSHIKNQKCVDLLKLSKRDREQVINQFKNRQRVTQRTCHELSNEELLSRSIIKLIGACYLGNKLYLRCSMTDERREWIASSTLVKSRVGSNLIRSAYRKKGGILR